MNNTAEQSAPQESEVLNQGARSENYMARFLTQTSDAFDSTKPFILGSPDPLKITPDKLQILDRYTLDYASNYWSGGEKKAMTHDQKLQEFGSKWANAITKRYALPKEGEAIYVAELNRRKDSGEVLKKLGLDPENMSVDAVRKFHDENFANGGRDVNAFISKVKQSLTAEEMRAHLDDIEFVARMFDRETAKDIRALIELDLDANKDNYAKRANAQAHPRSDEEKRRLRELSKYLMGGEPHKEIDGNGSASTSSKDSKAIVSGNMNQGAGRTGQTEKTDSHEKKHAEVKYIPVIYDSYSDNENIARALNTGKHLFNNEEPKSKSADLHSPRVSTLTPRKSVLNESDIENKLVVALLNIKGISDPEEEVKELVSLHDNIRTTQDTMLGIGIEPKKALHASLYDLDSQIARYEENTKTNIREDLLVASLFDDKLVLAIKGDMSAVVDRNGSAYILGKDNIVDANYDGKKLPDGVVMSEHQLGEEDGDIIVAGKNFWDVFQDRDEVFKLIAKLRQESPNISEAEISKQLADVLSKRGVAGEFSFVILKRTDRLKIKIGDGDKDVLDVTKQVVKTTRNTPADIEITAADSNPEPVLEVDVPAAQPGQGDLSGQIEIPGDRTGTIDAGNNTKASEIDWMNVSEAKIPEREFPVDAKLYGQEGDNLRIVISEPVLVQINKVLKEMSWKEGDFKEKGAVFIGKKYKDKEGKLWTDIVGAMPLLKTVSKWGEITFTPDSWVEAYNMIDHFLNVEKDGKRRPEEDQLELTSWVHTHPKGYEGVLSGQDEKPARTFVNPWNFAYVYAAGLGEDTPVDVSQVNASDVGKLFAFFSTGGAGTDYGTYNKHNGFYTRPKTDRDKAYGTGDVLPNGKAVDDLIKELEVILV